MSTKINDELLDIDGIKKSNKPLLDLFIRRTAVITSTQESLVEKIIKDQWSRANRASQADTSISEIDFCNLGVFYISSAKAKRRINKLEEIVTNTAKSEVASEIKKQETIKNHTNMIKAIKFKTKQLETNEN